MDTREMLSILDRLLDTTKAAVLSNVGADGTAQARWMSPALVRGRDGYLYAVTSPAFQKTADLKKTPGVTWLLQSKDIDEVLTLRGKIVIVDNPSVKAEAIEAIGHKLGTFWKLNKDGDHVVLETIIEEFEYFKPATGAKSSGKV